jgi:hypothetical protein
MITTDESGLSCKKVVVTYFKVLRVMGLGGSEGNK